MANLLCDSTADQQETAQVNMLSGTTISGISLYASHVEIRLTTDLCSRMLAMDQLLAANATH